MLNDKNALAPLVANEIRGNNRRVDLQVNAIPHTREVMYALANEDRLRILQLLGEATVNVQQIACSINLPISTTSSHIRILEDAGLVGSVLVPGKHGAMKMCFRLKDYIGLNLLDDNIDKMNTLLIKMPLGGYSRVYGIIPTCGLASLSSAIGEYDNPDSFYLPDRFNAQILWFKLGYIEYQFGALNLKKIKITALELSFEACSEAPMYRNKWESDIDVAINGQSLGIWTCEGDFGGRRGLLNPCWWPEMMTQYGQLVAWRVDEEGTWLNNTVYSPVTIEQLALKNQDCITVTIGVSPSAEHTGGMNLFGESFGDYPQAIHLKLKYLVD